MPKPKKNESKNDYLSRCTGDIVKNEGKSAKQAYAMCNRYWDEDKKQRSALSLATSLDLAKFKQGDPAREFLITAYTGTKIKSWFGDILIDISGIKTKEKMPILREHARDRVVGYGDAWKEDNFYISGRFSQSTKDAKEVLALADEGYPWQASISVRPMKVEQLEDEKTKSKVNGQDVEGPLEIWRETKVGEVSFVSLGADDNTAAITMSDDKFDVEIISKSPKDNNNENREDIMGQITIDLIKEKNPELLVEIEQAAEIAGATKERERIQSVRDQLIPGHEDLVNTLMFDGETTGPGAAVKILVAEKKLRTDTLEQHQNDAPPVVPDPSIDKDMKDSRLPVEERAKVAWDKDPKIRNEFDGDYDTYLAAEKAADKGWVKIIGGKDKSDN